MLTVGIPKELKPQENRVGLTPEAVQSLTHAGISVVVQKAAGIGAGFTDADYVSAGASIALDLREVYAKSGIIQKIKEPQPEEYPLFQSGQILFCYLHLASPAECQLLDILVHKNVTAIGFETLEKDGALPLLSPMSEMAGALSAIYAAYFRSLDLGREGKIVYPQNFQQTLQDIARKFPKCPEGLDAGKVVIYGGGTAGKKAMEYSLQMNGRVTVAETNSQRRDVLKAQNLNNASRLTLLHPSEIQREVLADADILIGCAHSTGQRAAQVLTSEGLKEISLHKKKIIMDIAIDQGGNFPEARMTRYEDSLYYDSFENTRFGVPNIPALCGYAATEVLTKLCLPYVMALAKDSDRAFKHYPELEKAVNVRGGRIVHPAIAEAHKR